MDPSKTAHTASGSTFDAGRSPTRKRVAHTTFAGRLGGNQEFIASPDDSVLLEKQPDAAPLQSIAPSFDLTGFADPDLWRMALLEGWGVGMIVFLLGSAAIGLTILNQSIFATTLYAALSNWFAVSIFTFCLGPVSGGHINPLITFATFFAGLSTFPRALLYIAAQSTGAIIAGFLLKVAVGEQNYFPTGVIPGCSLDTTLVTVGQMFLLEFMFSMATIFMAFGVGLDPRQNQIYGPAFGPVLVGITLGLTTLCSSILRPGYPGASLNPARCLGLLTAKHDLQYHWIHWVAPILATFLNGVFYHVAPPWRKEDPLLNRMADLVMRVLHIKHRGRSQNDPHHD